MEPELYTVRLTRSALTRGIEVDATLEIDGILDVSALTLQDKLDRVRGVAGVLAGDRYYATLRVGRLFDVTAVLDAVVAAVGEWAVDAGVALQVTRELP